MGQLISQRHLVQTATKQSIPLILAPETLDIECHGQRPSFPNVLSALHFAAHAILIRGILNAHIAV